MQNSINPFNIRPANRVNNISEYYFSKKLKEIAELNICRFIGAAERGYEHFPVRFVRVFDIVKGFA